MGKKICEKEPLEDIELDPKVQKRRNELFNRFVSPYLNMIYKLCIQYSWNANNVEENYTEVLTNFYRRIETYDPERSIRTWLHIVTKRHIMALERKRSYYNIENSFYDVEDIEDTVLGEEEVSSNVLGIDNYREYYNDDILTLLDGMKPIHKDALLLQEAGYSLKEIVEIEYQKGSLKSKNIDTVKSRLFLARQYLKKHLTRDGERIYGEADNESLHGDCDKTH